MKKLTALADRLVSRLVSPAHAQAACYTTVDRCYGGNTYRCLYDNCEHTECCCEWLRAGC